MTAFSSQRLIELIFDYFAIVEVSKSNQRLKQKTETALICKP